MKKLTIISICILLIVTIAACNINQNNEDRSVSLNSEKNDVEYEFTEDGIIKPEIAEKLISDTADKIITAIHEKDMKTVSNFIHPIKGVRFTPYTYVSLDNDTVFTKNEIRNFFENQNKYLWGYYDGSGAEINLTPSEYYEGFIYAEDFVNAEEVGYNTVLSSGNMLENQFEVYKNAIIIEYYFSGFNADYNGIDWKSLRLVFEELEGKWFLVGIINNQWTI